MAKVVTLNQFISNCKPDFNESVELISIFNEIVHAAPILSEDIRKAGLKSHILGKIGSTNVQGEEQQKLDVHADNIFKKHLELSGEVCGIASEENDSYIAFSSKGAMHGKYVVLFDPLDGSSNVDVNVSIGTIFSIYKRISPSDAKVGLADMLQKGSEQISSGYILYGPSTMLVFTMGSGVNGFTLDPSSGEFCLSHPKMQIPADGRIYAINEGNLNDFSQGLRAYVSYCQSSKNQSGKPYSGRYIGSLVADFHRNLIKGGIYIYPGISSSPEGRLRLLYECNPLAFIAEQAGGLATNGFERILSIEPSALHQRVPYVVGSKNMVKKVMSLISSSK